MYNTRIANSDLKVTPLAIGNGTRLASKGSLLILVRGSMLFNRVPMGIAEIDVAFNQDVKALTVIEGVNQDFLLNQLLAISPRIPVNETGIGAGKIETDTLAGLIVYLPPAVEQQRIADCLTSLDEVIAAQGRNVEALKAHKNGLMQQFFPREGETLPRLRFPEFRDADDWEERKLGGFITERSERASSEVPLYSLTIEAGVTAKTERYERSFLVSDETDAYKVVRPGDFAFNPMNLRFGAIGRHSGHLPVSLSKYYNIFSCDRSVDSSFCDIYFRSDVMVALYDRIATGSLIEKRPVHFDRFLKLDIPFPSRGEQQRIAACLSSLDARLAAEEGKLAALKTHRKGLMQQLFPPAERG